MARKRRTDDPPPPPALEAEEEAGGIAETVEVAERIVAEPRKRRGRSKAATKPPPGGELVMMAEMALAGVFECMAQVTGHAHWRRSPDDMAVAMTPLAAMIHQMPTKALRPLEGKILPASLILGLAVLTVPPIIIELQLRREERENARRNRAPGAVTISASYRGDNAPAAGPQSDSAGISVAPPRTLSGLDY